MNANFGRIMRIMEMNIWLLEPLFVQNIQIFNINIWLLVMTSVQNFVWSHKNDFEE